MKLIKDLESDYLKWVCETSAISSMDLLNHFKYGSAVWKIHIAGLAYGIWISSCDPNKITLDNIEEKIEFNVKINMN